MKNYFLFSTYIIMVVLMTHQLVYVGCRIPIIMAKQATFILNKPLYDRFIY